MAHRFLIAMTILVAGATATAAEVTDTTSREIVYPKHTIMRFADATVDGNLATPDGRWVVAQARRVGPKMIRVRKTFRRQILASLR